MKALRPKLVKDTWIFQGQADAMSHMTEGTLSLFSTRNSLMADWEVGWQDMVNKHFSIVGQWRSEYGLGAGVQIRF